MIGLYGGTFDPIHFGHLRPALEVCESLNLDMVRFIPAYQQPLKSMSGRAPQQRENLVRLAIADNEKFELDSRELDRKGASYTIDTLINIRSEVGSTEPLVLLVGSDAFSKLPQWHRWQDLLEYSHIAVMNRPGYDLNTDEFPKNWLKAKQVKHSSDIDTPAGNVIVCAITALDISSTGIRELIRQGQSIRYLVPRQVARTIEGKQLYK